MGRSMCEIDIRQVGSLAALRMLPAAVPSGLEIFYAIDTLG